MKDGLPDEAHWITLPQAMEAWAEGDGTGVKIAILDSGVDPRHPALGGLRLRDDLVVEPTFDEARVKQGCGEDLFGHGTAIAHLIRTMAPAAEIGSIRVLGSSLEGKPVAMRKGCKLAIERGYHILNCSWGHPHRYGNVEPHKDWLDQAYLCGVHVVAACNNYDETKREWPGHFATVVSVDKANCHEEGFFYRPGCLIEFAAKGYGVRVPWLGGSWKTVSGSSYAAPRVVGWIARLLSVYPFLSPPQVKALLRHLALERPYYDVHDRLLT